MTLGRARCFLVETACEPANSCCDCHWRAPAHTSICPGSAQHLATPFGFTRFGEVVALITFRRRCRRQLHQGQARCRNSQAALVLRSLVPGGPVTPSRLAIEISRQSFFVVMKK